MATTPEGKVKKALKRLLAEEFPRVWTYWPVSNGMGAHGVPDLLMCVGGRFIGIEVKSDTGRLTDLQHAQIAGIRDSGGDVYIVYGLADVEGIRVLLNTMNAGGQRQSDATLFRKHWTGTRAEYSALGTLDPYTFYLVTD